MPTLNQSQLAIAKRVYNAAIAAGVPRAKAIWIVAQTAHETAYYTSNVFQKNNNVGSGVSRILQSIQGMKMPKVRQSPYILGPGTPAPAGEGGGYYAKYSSIENSVRDMIHLLNYNKINWNLINTPAEYVTWLKSKGYFQGSESVYINNVSSFSAQLQQYLGSSSGWFAPAALFALIVVGMRGNRP